MRLFLTLALVATAVLASPMALAKANIAGTVTIANGSSYESLVNEYTKAWPGEVSSSLHYESRPISYTVNAGYHCIFYSESTRGIGSPIGEFVGPASGNFTKGWIMFYKCWAALAPRDSDDVPATEEVATGAPCGFSMDKVFGQQSLIDTGYMPQLHGRRLANFAVNGVDFVPESYHVVDSCNCWFYSAHGGRGGAELLLVGHGPAAGVFTGEPAQYACWFR